MMYEFQKANCKKCRKTFLKVAFLEYRVLGFCSSVCMSNVPVKAPTQQAYAIKQNILILNTNAKLDLDFDRSVELA